MAGPSFADDAPYHAHVYFTGDQREQAMALRSALEQDPRILFVGTPTEGKAGPHPIPQFELHFHRRSLDHVTALLRAWGLRALVHPLTDDDVADHTSLASWIGEPVPLDLSTLDPPGRNRGVARFGKSDF